MITQLSSELLRYYEEQFSMMSSVGWKDMCVDLEAVLVPLKDVSTATLANLNDRQGRIAELSFILNRRAVLTAAYEELSNGSA